MMYVFMVMRASSLKKTKKLEEKNTNTKKGLCGLGMVEKCAESNPKTTRTIKKDKRQRGNPDGSL
jgi:hypothetical protein